MHRRGQQQQQIAYKELAEQTEFWFCEVSSMSFVFNIFERQKRLLSWKVFEFFHLVMKLLTCNNSLKFLMKQKIHLVCPWIWLFQSYVSHVSHVSHIAVQNESHMSVQSTKYKARMFETSAEVEGSAHSTAVKQDSNDSMLVFIYWLVNILFIVLWCISKYLRIIIAFQAGFISLYPMLLQEKHYKSFTDIFRNIAHCNKLNMHLKKKN